MGGSLSVRRVHGSEEPPCAQLIYFPSHSLLWLLVPALPPDPARAEGTTRGAMERQDAQAGILATPGC
jgi:hypothetical protein